MKVITIKHLIIFLFSILIGVNCSFGMRNSRDILDAANHMPEGVQRRALLRVAELRQNVEILIRNSSSMPDEDLANAIINVFGNVSDANSFHAQGVSARSVQTRAETAAGRVQMALLRVSECMQEINEVFSETLDEARANAILRKFGEPRSR